MKDSKMLLQKFKEALKKYSTREVARVFSSFDRDYFNRYQDAEDRPITKKIVIGYSAREFFIMPWLFNEIVYYSTYNNDYKKSITDNEAWELYLKYFAYSNEKENEHATKNFSDPAADILAPILYGHMQEQSPYQVSMYLFINRFNRNYHLLKNEVFDSIDLETLIAEKYQTNLEDYIQSLSAIACLSMSNIPLNDDSYLKCVLDKELYLKILEEFSVSYEDCRSSALNEKTFRISPVLHTSFDEYIVPSVFTMFYNVGDSLYWLLKDEFKGGSTFIIQFGIIFEDYVFEILSKQYGIDNVERIPLVKGKKSADFIIKLPNHIFLIEVKSGVARAKAKQEDLDVSALNFYIENNIVDAMQQLDSSAKKYKDGREISCVIVNYDLIYVEDSLMIEISSRYRPQYYDLNNLLFFGIDYFERFIYKYNDLDKLEKLVEERNKDEGLGVHKLIENCDVPQGYFYVDIFNSELDKFIEKARRKQDSI